MTKNSSVAQDLKYLEEVFLWDDEVGAQRAKESESQIPFF